MFLAEQRGLNDTAQFRRYSTFSFADYQNPDKVPFGNLFVFNEEYLAASQSLTFTLDQDAYVLLIPITGAINVTDSEGNSTSVDVEELIISQIPGHHSFQITNPYQTEVISFLQLWIKAETHLDAVKSHLSRFSFKSLHNQLAELTGEKFTLNTAFDLPFSLCLGHFDGRQEAVYTLKDQDTPQLFAFVISGAFEIEGRLLHEKDSLALWDIDKVELEALSENALVLTLELHHDK